MRHPRTQDAEGSLAIPLRRIDAPLLLLFLSLLIGCSSTRGFAADWPMLGRTSSRNAVSPEKDAPLFWQTLRRDSNGQLLQPAQNIKWTARLGWETYGDPVVSDGLVWIGTNNFGLDPDDKTEAAVLLCFRASDGKRLYKYRSLRLPQPRAYRCAMSSLACSPLIERDRLWFTTNRCETVCLDIGPLLRVAGEPRVAWKVDMRNDLGIFPAPTLEGVVHLCSITGYGDWIYVITNNGSEDESGRVPSPRAPSLVCFDKRTGKVVWQDDSPGESILDGQWASPLAADIGGRGQVVAPLGDGWLRSFDPATGKLLWEFDMNFKESRWTRERSYRQMLLTAPVLYDNRLYIGTGLHPGYGGDRIEDQLHQMDSQVAIADGLVIAVDGTSLVHCFDAATGKRHWQYDMLTSILSSPLIVGEYVYLAAVDETRIFRLSPNPDVALRSDGQVRLPVARMTTDNRTMTSPIYADGVLYLAADQSLLAISAMAAPAD